VLLTFHGLNRNLRYSSFISNCGQIPIPIEAFCVAAGVSPLSILGVIVGEIVRLGAQANAIIAAVNQPRVVQKLVDRALDDEEDTRMEAATLLARATGFLPSPKGTVISVAANANANAVAQAAAAPVLAPPPEATIRRAVDRFNDQRAITQGAPSQSALPPETEQITYAQATTGDHSNMAEILRDDSDDEEEE